VSKMNTDLLIKVLLRCMHATALAAVQRNSQTCCDILRNPVTTCLDSLIGCKGSTELVGFCPRELCWPGLQARKLSARSNQSFHETCTYYHQVELVWQARTAVYCTTIPRCPVASSSSVMYTMQKLAAAFRCSLIWSLCWYSSVPRVILALVQNQIR
jgi:hypothetical protein